MKILITGSNGQLGRELQKQLQLGYSQIGKLPEQLIGANIIPVDLPDLDISKNDDVQKFLRDVHPDLIFNCAAYTNVDGCEEHSDLAYQANAVGPRNLAEAAETIGAVLVHISTDYVFSGKENGKIPQDETAVPDPISVYGYTKLQGERFIQQVSKRYFILRTAWLYSYYGRNFVKSIVNAGKKYGHLDVVNDQFGNPTNAADLAYEIMQLCVTDLYGLYHCTGNGICSWYDFASEIIRMSGVEASVFPCTSMQYKIAHPASASRPAWSALDNLHLRNTIGDSMRPWQEALREYFQHWDGKDGFKG